MSYTEIKNKEVKVRKATGCGWCAERIQVGERAQARTYVFDGDFLSDHMHPECYHAMSTYPDMLDLQDGWMPGDFARGSHSDEPSHPTKDE